MSYGFRPFFLFGAVWAALTVALWLPILSGHIVLPSAFGPIAWHSHELIFGYLPAIMAGFLLTAVPNWTGRLPITGAPLAALFGIWVVGRCAVFVSAWTGPVLAAGLDLLFLAALIGVIGREIIAGKNTRNLKILLAVGLLFAGNVVFHVEAALGGAQAYGARLGIAAAMLLIMLVGGRVVPSFTRNWLARRMPGRLPVPFNRFDIAVMLCGTGALVSWVVADAHPATAALMALAGLMNAIRLARWAGERTLREPLVLVLHVAYAFIPLGFLLLALAITAPGLIAPSGALHSWTTGAVGLMTLAVMTRATLGHTGTPLSANGPIQVIYVLAFTAAVTRIITAFDVAREQMLMLSAAAWVGAFVGFVICFGPRLLRSKT